MAGESDFDLGMMFPGDPTGGYSMPAVSAASLAGGDASNFTDEDEFGLRRGTPQPYWVKGGYGFGAEGADQGWQQGGITTTTPEMLAAMGFNGEGFVNRGSGESFENILNPELPAYMRNQGQTYGEHYNGELLDTMTSQVFDKAGNPIKGAGATWKVGNDDAFMYAAMLAGGLVGGAALGAGAAGAGGGGAAAAGGGATNAALIDSALGSAGYGASSAGLGGGLAGATLNPALIESALQTPGYGASSAGFGGGAGTSGFSLSGLAQRAGRGAATNAGMTAARGGSLDDILKGAGYGAVGGGLSYGVDTYNPGSFATDNPDWQKAINRGVTGAGSSALTGGNPLMGGAMGFGQSAGNILGNNLLNSVTAPQAEAPMPEFSLGGESMTPARDILNQGSSAPMGFTSSPEINASLGNNTQSSLFNPSFDIPMGVGPESSAQSANPFMSLLSGGGSPMMGGGGGFGNAKFGDMAGSLMGLYSAYDQRRKMKGLAGGLQDLYNPNGAYAQQLGQQLARRDAAAGRRSQYGPRQVELMARLADLNSRNAPQLAQLYSAQQNGTNAMLNNALRFGQQSGLTGMAGNYLQNLYNQYGGGGWGTGNQYGNEDIGGFI